MGDATPLKYLLDTHTVHAAVDPHAAQPLSRTAHEAMATCTREDLAISAATLLELARHLNSGVINTPDHLRWLERIEQRMTVVPITPRLAYSSAWMPWRRRDRREHTDPADRLIVATAIRFQLTIIGNDAEMWHISASHGFRMVW